MNIRQTVGFIVASANAFPLQASFKSLDGGGYSCKLCGAKIKDQASCADHLLSHHREMEARDFSEGRRKSLAKSGKAMPGGGFPIVNRSDLANAKRAIGRAKNPAAARAHINERAKALGEKPIGQMESGGPGSGRHEEDGPASDKDRDFADELFKKVREGSIRTQPGGRPDSARSYVTDSPDVWRASAKKKKKKKVAGQFAPSDRLMMPKNAGQDTTSENPQYTGGQPQLRAGKKEGCCEACNEAKRMSALGMKISHGGMKHSSGCSSHGFHRGPGYESKARSMGHRLPLSAAAERPVRIIQRPVRSRRRQISVSFRGYQII